MSKAVRRPRSSTGIKRMFAALNKTRDINPRYYWAARTRCKNPILRDEMGEVPEQWTFLPWVIWDSIGHKLGCNMLQFLRTVNWHEYPDESVIILYLAKGVVETALRIELCSDEDINQSAWEGFTETIRDRQLVHAVLVLDTLKEVIWEWRMSEHASARDKRVSEHESASGGQSKDSIK